MAGKRVSLASLAGAKVEAVPGAGRPDLLHVHPDTVAPTPLNPRRNFDETELAELGEDMRAGQLQPCVAVHKATYLKLYPEHADRLPDACRYVMAAGERRWKAAVLVGLDTLDVLLRHDLTESRIRFFAAVLSENVQRANFNPIEEANGLHAMLDLHDGNQSAAAKAMGKSKQWFNQRIGLLRLTDEMVQLVLEGKLTAFRDMRRYASLPPEEQYATWKADQEQPRPAPEPRLTPVPERASETYTAVYAPGPPAPEDTGPEPSEAPGLTAVKPESAPQAYTAVYAPTPEPVPAADAPAVQNPVLSDAPLEVVERPDSIPEPREAPPAEPADRRPPRLPYDDGVFLAMHLIRKMPGTEFTKMMGILREYEDTGVTPVS